jgi:dienelactone hydrolase
VTISSEGIVTAIRHRLPHPAPGEVRSSAGPGPEPLAPEAALAAGEESFYLAVGEDATFVTLHRAATASATAVILCPPFGWEEVSSYRPRRVWAQSLSRAGYCTLRVTLPSTGDSSGAVHDPARVAAWTAALEASAGWLRRETGARRIVAIGMELGGMLAYRCAAQGGEIDDLVLWATMSKGRALLRQFKAFSRLEAGQFFEGLAQPPALPPGDMEAGGFTLSAETVRDLEQLDLAALDLPEPARRRVLLLQRDGMAVDARLADHLAQMGVSVTTAPGPGYAGMTSHPQFAEPATEVFSAVARWIAETNPPAPPAIGPEARGADAPDWVAMTRAELGEPDAAWTETPVTITCPDGRLAAILVLPRHASSGGLCAVLLNAGAVRRIGPNRMWVETARRWAVRGVPTLRLDVVGIGDADGPAVGYPDDAGFHRPALIAQVRAALDVLQAEGVGDRFLLGGLCSGAYWAFQTSVADPRVCAAAIVNPRVLVWDTGVAPARHLRTLLTERPSLTRIRQVATPALVGALVRWLIVTAVTWVIGAPRRWLRRHAEVPESDVDRLLTELIDSGKRALLMFSEREPLYGELVRAGRIARLQAAPNVTMERLSVTDHTLRPSWAQDRAQEALDRMLELEVDAGQRRPLNSAAGPV